MRMLWKGALLGATAGAAVAGARAYQRDEPMDVVVQKAGKTAAGAAGAGLVLGFVLDRRSRRKLAKKRATTSKALAAGTLFEAARAARPAIENALEVTPQAATPAADAARPRVEPPAEVPRNAAVKAAEAARPRIERAAEVAWETAK